MNKIAIFWKGLPLTVKLVIFAVVVIILILAILAIKKAFKKNPGKSGVEAASDELHDLKQTGETLTYSESQYYTWADLLQQEMAGGGTDEEAIQKIINKMRKKIDVLELIKAFGMRDYTDDQFYVWNVKPLNLNGWLGIELDGDDLEKYVNSTLKKNGVDYSF